MTQKIKPLIIGIGVAGKRHLDAQLNLGIQTGIYTTNPQTIESLKKHKNIIVFENLDKGIDWANLVQVCTPDDRHTEFVAKSLKKGKPVLCEKSLTTNFKDASYLQHLARKYKTKVFVGQNNRLTPTFAEIKKRVQNGQLGKITSIKTTYFHDKIDFQNRYLDQYFLYIGGSHAVDLACWITDEQIVSLQTSSKNPSSFDIKIKFTSGLQGSIQLDASSKRAVSGVDLIVSGRKGELISHNKSDKLVYKQGSMEVQAITLPNTKTQTIPLEVKIIDNYLLGITNSYWPIPTIDEAVNTIKVLDTVKKASSSGKVEKV